MTGAKNGPRSNFSLLPFEIQYKIIALLQDGATFAVLQHDREIAQAYADRGLNLVPAAVSRLKKSRQYKEWAAQRLRERSLVATDRLTTELLKENAAVDTIAEQTKVALLKALSELTDLSELSDESRVKALRSITASVAALTGQHDRKRIDDLQKKLDEANRDHEAAAAKWREREAALETENARLRELVGRVNGDDVVNELNKSVGL